MEGKASNKHHITDFNQRGYRMIEWKKDLSPERDFTENKKIY